MVETKSFNFPSITHLKLTHIFLFNPLSILYEYSIRGVSVNIEDRGGKELCMSLGTVMYIGMYLGRWDADSVVIN